MMRRMALTADEIWTAGFVRDATTKALIVTTDDTGARMQGGHLRDPDGRLVVQSA